MAPMSALQRRAADSDECIEHCLQLECRTANDLQDIGSGGLLLEGFCQVSGALAQFVEQPRVLNGDDGLGGEILNQRDLLVGKRPHFLR